MYFSILSQYLEKIEKTASRNEMTEILADLFKKCSKDEIDKVCYLSLGRLAPKYRGIEFNMAEKMAVRTLAVVGNKSETEVSKIYKKMGDLGEAALKLKIATQNSKLSVSEVYEKLFKIAEDSGEGSVDRKINGLADLLKKLDPLSAKYVARIPVNKLRLGFSDMTVLDALSWMKKGDKSLRKDLERGFNVLADIGKIAQIFRLKGLKGLKGLRPEAGVPIRAAKAERLPDAEKILEKMKGECALEPKLDGFRTQIHIDKDKSKVQSPKSKVQKNLFEEFDIKKDIFVQIFSRNLDNTTHMFPDVVEAAQKLKVKSAILDGEAIAVNPKTGKFLPFQETVQRKRKHGVGKKAKELPLKVFVFDVLYLDGKPLLDEPFRERRKRLEKILKKSKGEEKGIVLTEQKVVKKASDFDKFFKKVVKEGLEGLMAKKLEAPYQAGARNFTWVKYKAGMKSELADTVDCVVMGYYGGKGKRSSFGIGAFLVGAVSDKSGKSGKVEKGDFLTVSKIGTGLTDEQWKEMFKRCEGLKVAEKPKEYVVDKNLYPDVWCRPKLVVEIEADTITKSPIHTAGLALRFPRLKRFRDDKDANQATSLGELQKLAKIKK